MPCIRRAAAHVCTLVVLGAAVACAGDGGVGTDGHSGSALTVRISPKTDSLGVGESRRFAVQVVDQAGVPRSATVAWMSINNTIATVNASGDVTALAPGLVGIVATIGSSADTASVFVLAGQLVVEPNAIITAVGEEIQLSATTRSGVAASGAPVTWRSSDNNVATVSSDGTVTAVGAGDATLTAVSGDQTGSALVSVKSKDVESLRITPATSSLYPKATAQLQVTAFDDAGRTMAVTASSARWTSSSSTVLTVTDDGLVTGKAKGSAIVTARIGNKSATATVNVLDEPVASVDVALDASSLEVGQITQAKATLKDASGGTLSNRPVAWQSSNPSISTVNSLGVVTAVARGSATISAISDGKVGGAALTVAPKTVATVVVTPNPASATVGQAAQLTATPKDAAGVAMTGRTITWTSGNTAVATVSATGLVTAVSSGSATISATADGVTGQSAFTVTAITAASVAVSPSSPNVQIGQDLQMSATAYDGSGNPLASRVPVWSSSNPTIATVSNTGRVTGVAKGSANISASVDGKTASALVAVNDPPPAGVASITVVLHNPAVNVGQTTWASAELRDASGQQLTGRTVSWSSAVPTLATVSNDGTVTTIGAGSVSIVATSEGMSGSATLVINGATAQPVATVSLSAISTSMYVGQSQAITVTLRDASGNTLSGRTIGWSSSNLSALTVSPSGQVQAVGVGSSTVTATSEGKTGTLSFTVTAAPVAPVASVTVNGGSSSLNVGQSTQMTATPKDAQGNVLTGRTVTWTSSASGIASVSSSGNVSAVAAGTAVINATVGGVVGSMPLTVIAATTPPPPPDPTPSVATPAELPRAVPSFSIPAPTRVVTITAGMDLQAALNNAQRGDELVLSGTFTGNFILRSCAAGWITVRGASSLPAQGVRVTPGVAAGYAKIITNNTEPAIRTEGAACRWAFRGLEIVGSLESTQYLSYGIVRFGEGGETQRTLASVPTDFLLAHSYVHGTTNHNNTRCVVLNSANSIVRDSWITDCHARGSDSQAIEGWNGPGPYLIENNRVEGAGENIMFGGADPGIYGLRPSDITIRGNHVMKPLSWKGGPWSIKNLFELKNALRVLVEQNVFENSWPASQEGMAIVIKSSQDACGTCVWQGTTDLTFRWNVVRDAAVGLNLQGYDASGQIATTTHTARVTVTNNLFERIGAEGRAALMMFTHDLADVNISNNTFTHDASVGMSRGGTVIMDYGDGTARRMEWKANVVTHGAYGVFYNGLLGSAAMQRMAGDGSWRFSGNTIAGGSEYSSKYPTGNTWVSTVPTTSVAGVDRAELTRRITGVVVP